MSYNPATDLENIDEPVSNDLDLSFSGHASLSFDAEAWLPVAGGSEPAVIFALQKKCENVAASFLKFLFLTRSTH